MVSRWLSRDSSVQSDLWKLLIDFLQAHCSPCLPGHYCNSTGLLVPTGQCAEGFYCTLGSTLPVVPAVDKTGGPCPTGRLLTALIKLIGDLWPILLSKNHLNKLHVCPSTVPLARRRTSCRHQGALSHCSTLSFFKTLRGFCIACSKIWSLE